MITMNKKVLLAALFFFAGIGFSFAQDDNSAGKHNDTVPQCFLSLSNDDLQLLMTFEKMIGNGLEWDSLSDEKQEMACQLANIIINWRTTQQELAAVPNIDSLLASKTEEQASQLAHSLLKEYLVQTPSAISLDYLVSMKAILMPYKYSPVVEKCLQRIDIVNKVVVLDREMIAALKEPYQKSRHQDFGNRLSLLLDSLSPEQRKEVYSNHYTHYVYFEVGVKLFQSLIRDINTDKEMIHYRTRFRAGAGDAYRADAFEKVIYYLQKHDSKTIDGDSHGDNFEYYISHIPWLNDRFSRYRQSLLSNPLEQLNDLENEILSIKL